MPDPTTNPSAAPEGTSAPATEPAGPSAPESGLEAVDVSVSFGRHRVLDRVSLTLRPGESLGLAGPSGCGKSTLARVLALLLRPSGGAVRMDGHPITRWRHRAPQRTRVALIFQQPRMAVDPRFTLEQVITEPLRATGRPLDRAYTLAEDLGLTGELFTRRPHEVSDGQLQRACVARALTLEPAYLICDEMTTMLDASTQAHLVSRIEAYREETGAAVLAISHDTELLDRWTGGNLHVWHGVSTVASGRGL